MEFVLGRAPRAKYTVVGETLRYVIPSHMQCSLGCGGRACKYENPDCWGEDKQAIKGLYSSWVTDNLLAMARPSTELIERYQIIEQFLRCGVRTVINLQHPGEHASCGFPLEAESGFTYRPETLMEAGIYFYNFAWNDYGIASLTTILDMVKVMSFAVQEGKMAVHCHAGLGRTGVLLACFLVFTSRVTADQAILYVRAKRPNSIQTRGQLLCVRQFARFLVPLRNVFAHTEPKACAVTLSQYLVRQGHMLHGYERRLLRNLPKLVQLVCKLLQDIAENRQVIEEELLEVPDITADMERDVSHNAMQHFTREMIGRGVLGMKRLPGPGIPTAPKDFVLPPLHYARKSLSYSESDLRNLSTMLNLTKDPLAALASMDKTNRNTVSQNNVSQGGGAPPKTGVVRFTSTNSVWDLKTLMDQKEGSPLLNKRRQSFLQRSKSLGISTAACRTANDTAVVSAWRRSKSENGEEEERSEVPFITIQTELTLEARRLLVAQSLAVDLDKDGEEEHRQRLWSWQSDLNQQGAWERLCLERDPFVLSGIMWSWLEQLKEPVISAQDVQVLHNNSLDSKASLQSLDKAPRETITCILGCFAHMLTIPQEVEDAFLERIIKALTTMRRSAEGGGTHEILNAVLRPVLHDMRAAALKELEVPDEQ